MTAALMTLTSFAPARPTGPGTVGSIECVTDERLVADARRGDAAAFDRLVERHQTAAFRAALAALGNAADAEEVAQDAFVRAWSRLETFRGDASFRTWLLTIVWNRALSRRRSVVRWLRRSAPLEDAAAVAATGATDAPIHDAALRTEAQRAIRALSPKLRDTLLLAQSGDYGYEEIAGMLGVAEGTVKWRVSEARRQVRARLAARGYASAH